jgi:class 3 adenylate cyclase
VTQTLDVPICPSCATPIADDAKFCQECGGRLSTSGLARRRLVTALFCDLVGSTELGEHLDPELLRKVLDPYFDAMRKAIERHGGTVEKFMGDAVVGAFGVPTAHEDDTLRAVRAALEMRKAAAEQDAAIADPDVRVRVRIAISCAEAFADESAARQGRISGDAFNTAARLQAVGNPGDVLISGAAEQILRGRVDLSPLGPIALRGKAQPIDAYRLLRIRPTPIRIGTPLVGRDRSVTALRAALEDAIDARACVLFTVLAPPGVGKSRLATAFADSVRDRAEVLVGQTPAYGDGITFAPLVELLAEAAARRSSDAEAIATALRDRLAAEPDGVAVGDRLAHVLGIGEATATDTAWAVRRLFEVLASRRPLVVVVEDVHWAEPPMLDLVDAIVERFHGPALFLCLARPELLEQRPVWAAGKPRATTTTLLPLASHDARRLAELLLGQKAPSSVIDRVCETAEGNPLYLEQLTAMLADQGLLSDGGWTGSEDADVEIPLTLQALLAARFDRLDPATRLLLERASVEGRRFRISALGTLAPEAGTGEVEAAMATLERRGFVQVEEETTGRWRFAHSLLREAAYRGLSKELRAELHERLADWVLTEDANQPDADESAARHLERAYHLREELGAHDGPSAALSVRAGELFADAGTRAFAALDLITARELLGRAAMLLPERSPRRFDLLPNLGVALTETGRPAETEALLSGAAKQAGADGLERDALRARVQLLSNCVYRSPTEAEIASAADEARAAADVFTNSGDDVGLAEAAIAIEYLEFMRGRIADAFHWTLLGLRVARAAGRSREATQAAADIVGTAVTGPLPFDRFAGVAEQHLSSQDDPISVSSRHALLALAALGVGDQGGFHEHEQRWLEVVGQHGLAWLAATHALQIGSIETSSGDAVGGEKRLREARDVLAGLGDIWWVIAVDGNLCAAVAAQDRPQEFLRLADAFDESLLVPDRQTLIRLSLIRSKAHLLRGSPADAEAAARRGLELAESSDLILDHANALFTLADALDTRGLLEDAASARGGAITLLRAKGHMAAVARLEGR